MNVSLDVFSIVILHIKKSIKMGGAGRGARYFSRRSRTTAI